MKTVAIALTLIGFFSLTCPSALAADVKITISECQVHNTDQEAADWEVVQKAYDLFAAQNTQGLDAMLPELEAALSHAPDQIIMAERCGTTLNIYTDSEAALALMPIIQNAGDEGLSMSHYSGPLPYGDLGLLVGWIYFERGDYENAAKAYEKGLKNRNDITNLAGEYALTLYKLGRIEEGLKIVTDFIDAGHDISDVEKGILWRKKGYGLVELKRWDEAKTAYEESLKFQDSDVAKSELQYIQDNRP